MGASQRKRLIIAIDGPSGAGKSTAARSLAKRLGYLYIDTGAMYRAVALKVKTGAVSPENDQVLSKFVSTLRISLIPAEDGVRVLCNGEDITEAIRSPEISRLASDISKRKGVREALVRMQREMGRGGGVVLEGRDIGTVVFPDADVKFYLDADSEERAMRRFKELAGKGAEVNYQETLEEVRKRDHNDMSRALSPLRKADDAICINSTRLSAEEVTEELVRIIVQKEKGVEASCC
ncbi:MAG: cytidylate kinase [Deltaproteobacteria bacterium RBG_16_50_11]|nr:MAG: cytidylate kinase [Deltaproteobacteria bacterium RBG_16_50_11]